MGLIMEEEFWSDIIMEYYREHAAEIGADPAWFQSE